MKCLLSTLFLLLLFSCQSKTSRTATVVFVSDTKVEIEINDPIDGCPNPFHVTRKIELDPNIPVSHQVNVDEFVFLNVESRLMNMRHSLLLLEGDSLTVGYKEGKTVLTGDNAAGIEYLYTNYIRRGLMYHVNRILPLMESKVKETIDFEGLDSEIGYWRENLTYKNDLIRLLEKNEISERAFDILNKTFEYAYLDCEGILYMGTMQGQVNGYVPTKEENIELLERIAKLYKDKRYLNDQAPRYLYSPSSDYYMLKYRYFDEHEKEKHEKMYDKSIFGNYISWTLAPDYLQQKAFGDQAIFELQNGVGQLCSEEFVQWFQDKFPGKQYSRIISSLYAEHQEKSRSNEDSQVRFLDSERVNTFQDLSQLEELKGERLYVDLWASWCSPCLAQFKYNEDVHDLLNEYEDMSIVYISIDKDREEETWKRQINTHNLNGFHMRATESFLKHISSELYGGQLISIPRYLLLDESGEIMDANIPRPSEIEKLKEILEEKLSQ